MINYLSFCDIFSIFMTYPYAFKIHRKYNDFTHFTLKSLFRILIVLESKTVEV